MLCIVNLLIRINKLLGINLISALLLYHVMHHIHFALEALCVRRHVEALCVRRHVRSTLCAQGNSTQLHWSLAQLLLLGHFVCRSMCYAIVGPLWSFIGHFVCRLMCVRLATHHGTLVVIRHANKRSLGSTALHLALRLMQIHEINWGMMCQVIWLCTADALLYELHVILPNHGLCD